MLVRYAVLCHDRQSNVQLCGCEVLCDVRSDDTLAVSHCSVTFLVLTEISSATSAGKLPVSAAMVGVEQQSSAGAQHGPVSALQASSMAKAIPASCVLVCLFTVPEPGASCTIASWPPA